MKIALCYSGYLRTWDLCKYNHWETFKDQDVSGFFYTYEDPKENDEVRTENGISFFTRPRICQWIKTPGPFYADPFGEHKFNSRKVPENTACQVLNQWINNFTAFRLTPEKGYDIYVRIRPDIKFNGKLDFSKFDCTGKTIYIPQGFDYGGICDQFAFGNYDVMKAYYSVLLNCYDIWNEGATFHAEGFQLKNLQKEGINVVRYGSPQHDIIR